MYNVKLTIYGAYHPTLWTFIDTLKVWQHLKDIKPKQFVAGTKIHHKKIRKLTLQYER